MLPTRADREANQHSWPWFKAGATALASRMGANALIVEGLLKPAPINGLQAFFGPTTTVVQPTSSVDDQAQRELAVAASR